MKSEQKIVVAWMKWVLCRRKWSAEEWARRAEISPTTVTRAMRPSYDGVTSLPILDKLARVANLPSPLEVLLPGKLLIDIPNLQNSSAKLPEKFVENLQHAVHRQVVEYLKSLDSPL